MNGMQSTRRIRKLFLITLGIASLTWAQGGRRGNQQAAQQAPPQGAPPAAQNPPAQGNAGRGGRGGGGAGSNEFYNYDANAASGVTLAESQPVESHQKITLNGESLAYAAHAGFLSLHNATTGQPEAQIFYTSYGKDGVTDLSSRPIVFFMAGGPGVAAAWQEFGGLGPKRIKADSLAWSDNPATLLGQADLVFVDPVGTGFSRPDHPSRASAFWTSAGDVASLGEFVRSFLIRHARRTSPLFLAGEDAGTGRVAGLAAYLVEHDVPVSGIALLSMASSADSTAGDERFITLLPSLVMSAWVHKKLSPELSAMSAEQISSQARQFASREYLHALYKGDRMTVEERNKVVADLARLTGMSKQFVISNNLRISLDRFNSELMREQRLGMAVSDARVTGFLPETGGGGGGRGRGFAPAPTVDFNLSALSGRFLSAYDSYLRNEIGFKGNPEGIYYLNSGGVGAFTGGADDGSLSAAFTRDPALKMFVAVNYFDLSAPFYATEFTLAHLNISSGVRAHNITVRNYEAGRLVYMDNKESARLGRDLSSFVSDASHK